MPADVVQGNVGILFRRAAFVVIVVVVVAADLVIQSSSRDINAATVAEPRQPAQPRPSAYRHRLHRDARARARARSTRCHIRLCSGGTGDGVDNGLIYGFCLPGHRACGFALRVTRSGVLGRNA